MIPSVLQRPTLVLNRNWQPVHVSNVQRALVLLYGGAARVVEPHSYQVYSWEEWLRLEPTDPEATIHAARFRLRAPDVVTLARFDRLPQAAVSFSKRNILKRDHFTCQYCGAQPGREELTIDHVTPRSLGGGTNWENCVTACLACNRRKANHTPAQANMHARKRPKQPAWRSLFFAISQRQRQAWSVFLQDDDADAA